MKNSQILYEWLNKMDKGQENVFFALSMDPVNNLVIYTTLDDVETLKKRMEHLIFLLNNSKQIINL